MNFSRIASIIAGAAVSVSTFTGAALAQQPLDIVVRPVTAIVQAPFVIVGGVFGRPTNESRPAAVFNLSAAQRRAVGFSADGTPVIRARTLRATGPTYVNPPNADWSRPIVLNEGDVVPTRVPLAPVLNASVAGLQSNTRYDVFVSPTRGHVVFVDPVTAQIARIVR